MARQVFCLLVLAVPCLAVADDDRDRLKVGVQPDGRIVVPTNQILKPAGTQVTFPGRPVDLLLIDDGKTLVAKNMRNLVFIDAATGAVRQTLALPAARQGRSAAFSAVGLVALGDRIYASDSQNYVRVAARKPDGTFGWDAKDFQLKPPAVGGAAYPTGLAVQSKNHLWVCCSRGNELQLRNVDDGAVAVGVPVGVAPYMALVVGTKVYVSNWGGDPPGKDDPAHKTSGTPVHTDARTSVATHGSVSVVMMTEHGWKQMKTIAVGGHPCGMAASADRKLLYVANANSDTVSVIDTVRDQVVATIDCKPEGRLPFGSGPNAVAV